MSRIESIVQDLMLLTPEGLESAADFVHRLRQVGLEERNALLRRTAGSLSPDEGAELASLIEDGCERVDERGW